MNTVIVPKDRLIALIAGLQTMVNNARARKDKYDAGYLGAMREDAYAMLAEEAWPAPSKTKVAKRAKKQNSQP